MLFWHDPWIDKRPLISIYGTKIVSLAESSPMICANLYMDNRHWNLPNPNHTIMDDLRSKVSAINIQLADSISWLSTPTAHVRISTIWNSLRKTRVPPS